MRVIEKNMIYMAASKITASASTGTMSIHKKGHDKFNDNELCLEYALSDYEKTNPMFKTTKKSKSIRNFAGSVRCQCVGGRSDTKQHVQHITDMSKMQCMYCAPCNQRISKRYKK